MQTCSESDASNDCFSVTDGIYNGVNGFVGLPGDVATFENTFNTAALQYAFWQPDNVMSEQNSGFFG